MAKRQIHEQGQALSVYFEDMLAEPQHKQAPAAEKEKPEPVQTEADISHATEVMPEPDATVEAPSEHTAPSSETLPQTSQHKLLLCEIGGMKLAIAFSALNNIVHWPAQGLSPLAEQQSLQLGLLTDRAQDAEVIDIRPLLHTPDADASHHAAYILLVDDHHRGIACDRIKRIVTVDDNEIEWHPDKEQSPWLSGVIAESDHTILDLPALLKTLVTDEMA